MRALARISLTLPLIAALLSGCAGSLGSLPQTPAAAQAPGYVSLPLQIAIAQQPASAVTGVTVIVSASGYATQTTAGACAANGCSVAAQAAPTLSRVLVELTDANHAVVQTGAFDAEADEVQSPIAVAFGGTPARIDLSVDPAQFAKGKAGSATLAGVAYDAQGRQIVGSIPYAAPVALSSSSAAAKLASAQLLSPASSIAVTFDGTASGTITFSGSVPGATVRNVQVPVAVGPTQNAEGGEYGDLVMTPQETLDAIPTAPPVPPSLGPAASSVLRRQVTPASADLRPYLPPVADQASTNMCTVFSGVYAIRTELERIQRASDPVWKLSGSGVFGANPAVVFSPSFTYNQPSVNNGIDDGSHLEYITRSLTDVGAVSLAHAPLTADPALSYRTPQNLAIAANFRIKDFYTIPSANVDLMKRYVAGGIPVYIGVMVDDGLGMVQGPNAVWSGYSDNNRGGHAMAIVGYNDTVAGGSFLVVNSWGTQAHDGGFFWLPYSFWTSLQGEALVMIPNPIVPGAMP